MNQSYAHMNAPYATLTRALCVPARNVFGVYKNNARALTSPILSTLKSDWLQHVRSVRRVY